MAESSISARTLKTLFPPPGRPQDSQYDALIQSLSLGENYTYETLKLMTPWRDADTIAFYASFRIQILHGIRTKRDQKTPFFNLVDFTAGTGGNLIAFIRNPTVGKIYAHEIDPEHYRMLLNNIRLYDRNVNTKKGRIFASQTNAIGLQLPDTPPGILSFPSVVLNECAFFDPPWLGNDSAYFGKDEKYPKSDIFISTGDGGIEVIDMFIRNLLISEDEEGNPNGPRMIILKVPPLYEVDRTWLSSFHIEVCDFAKMRVYFICRFPSGDQPARFYLRDNRMPKIETKGMCIIPTHSVTRTPYNTPFFAFAKSKLDGKMIVPDANNTSDLSLYLTMRNYVLELDDAFEMHWGSFIVVHSDKFDQHNAKRNGDEELWNKLSAKNSSRSFWDWDSNGDTNEFFKIVQTKGRINYLVFASTDNEFEINGDSTELPENLKQIFFESLCFRYLMGVPRSTKFDFHFSESRVREVSIGRLGYYYHKSEFPAKFFSSKAETSISYLEQFLTKCRTRLFNSRGDGLFPIISEMMKQRYPGLYMSLAVARLESHMLARWKEKIGEMPNHAILYKDITGHTLPHNIKERKGNQDWSLFGYLRTSLPLISKVEEWLTRLLEKADVARKLMSLMLETDLDDVKILNTMHNYLQRIGFVLPDRTRDRIQDIYGDLDIVKEHGMAGNPNFMYLDIGSSEGKVTADVSRYLNLDKEHTHACDISPQRETDAFMFSQNSDKNLPYGDSQFDFITMFMSLHHFEFLKEMLTEAYRVARPNAFVLLREHGGNEKENQVFYDIVHAMYNCVLGREMDSRDFIEKYSSGSYAFYHTSEQWEQILSDSGFVLVSEMHGPLSGQDVFDAFYALFQKVDL